METDSSNAFKMSSTIDIEDTNQEQANATPPGSPTSQGEEEEVEYSNQNKSASDGRQHQEEQLGWREWMVSLRPGKKGLTTFQSQMSR